MSRSPYSNIADVKNVVAMVELVERVNNSGFGLPRMACFCGPSGFGKTAAATYAANVYDAVYVQAKSVWNKSFFAEKLCEELGIEPKRTLAHRVDQIATELAVSGRILLIDEADHLVKKKMIEMVRDIYESSGATIILIGEEQMPQKLKDMERVHGRMRAWVLAEETTLDDLWKLAPIYAPDVTLDEAFAKQLLAGCRYSVRRVCINLQDINQFGLKMNLERITQSDWTGRAFFQGDAPKARHGVSA